MPKLEIEILGLKINKNFSFTGHVEQMAKKMAGRLICTTHFVSFGRSRLQHSVQIPSTLFISILSSYLSLLHKIKERAHRLIKKSARVTSRQGLSVIKSINVTSLVVGHVQSNNINTDNNNVHIGYHLCASHSSRTENTR